MTEGIIKYPRTPHLEGSALQAGDEDLSQVPASSLRGLRVVPEEKLDGANSGFFFDSAGRPHVQSRGHELDLTQRGGRERHFNLFKDWVLAHQDALLERFEDRYLVYGEWMYASHTVFYDDLPSLFMEFDVWDRRERCFLDTLRRRQLLDATPIVPVPVLKPLTNGAEPGESTADFARRGLWRSGDGDPAIEVNRAEDLAALVRHSVYKTGTWRESLAGSISRHGLDFDRTASKIDRSNLSEGIYGKVEKDGRVVSRFKWVRHGFLQKVHDVNEHWLSRPILPNVLAPGVDIFAQVSSVGMALR